MFDFHNEDTVRESRLKQQGFHFSLNEGYSDNDDDDDGPPDLLWQSAFTDTESEDSEDESGNHISGNSLPTSILSTEGAMDWDETRNKDDVLVDEEMTNASMRQECCNCHRCPATCDEIGVDFHKLPFYDITIDEYESSQLSFTKKFCTMKARDYRDEIVLLCGDCGRYLQKGSNHETRLASSYPALLWKLLTSAALLQRHGDYLWSLVLLRWHSWWIHSVHEIPSLAHVSVHYPKSLVVDITFKQHQIRECLAANKAAMLKKVLNEYFYPVVKCPWGCTDYSTKCGVIPFNVVLQRLLGNDVVCLSPSKEDHVQGVREDFLVEHEMQETYFFGFMNVMPSAAFDIDSDGNPTLSFLTCSRRHDGSCRECYLHMPRSLQNALPSRHGDQIAPAVIVPRVLKPVQARAYSNSYQMVKMSGHFAGVDTMSLTNSRKLDFESRVTSKNESAAIMGRKDICAIVSRWTEENLVVPPCIAMEKLETAPKNYPQFNELDREWKGSTYVTFEDAIRLQAMVHWQQGSTVKVWKRLAINAKLQNEITYEDVHYVPKWCRYLTWVHPCNAHGARPPPLPITNRFYDYRLLWIMSGLLSTIPEMWEDCTSRVIRNDEYNGWLLSYVVMECYPERASRGGKRGPFQYPLQARKSALSKESFVMSKLMQEVSCFL